MSKNRYAGRKLWKINQVMCFLAVLMIFFAGCSTTSVEVSQREGATAWEPSLIPEYQGEAYVEVNQNIPFFTEEDMTTTAFEKYSQLDVLGRCGQAFANIGQEIMPTEARKSIGHVRPSGWNTVKYSEYIEERYLYNRCHLIAFCLAGENDNEKNLITGTRYMNIEGMQPFEEKIANYVDETKHHVLYRVTPMYKGDNLVASGVLLEARSVEDKGSGIEFCVYCYNVQPNITIDYETGDSYVSADAVPIDSVETEESSKGSEASGQTEGDVWVPVHGGKKYHASPDCSHMKEPRQMTEEAAIAKDYTPCKKCY